jgi:hypothetical protein
LREHDVAVHRGHAGADAAGGPGLFDTEAADYTDQLGDFYQRYLAATEQADGRALDSFGLSREFAAGLPFLERLPGISPRMVRGRSQVPSHWGQLAGPEPPLRLLRRPAAGRGGEDSDHESPLADQPAEPAPRR